MTALGTIVAASPLNADDASRYTGFTTGGDITETATFALDNMPTDFGTMNTLSWTYDGRENITGGDDSEQVLVRIVNGATILAAADSGGTFQQIYIKSAGGFSTTDATRGPTAFTYVNTAADKATWDGASVEIRRINVKNKGVDGVRPEPDYFAITGDYTAASTDRRAQISFAELEVPNAPRRAQISFAELEIPSPLPTSITDDFSGDLSQWNDLSTDSATFEINTGELLMTTGATASGEARAQARIQDLSDVEVLLLFTPGTADLVINVRTDGTYNSGDDVPQNGYSLTCQESGNTSMALYRNVSGSQQLITSDTRPNNNPTWVRLRVEGTTLQARFWEDGTSEPGTWNIDTTDSNISGPGSVELTTWRNGGSSNTVRVDDVSIGPASTDRRAQVSFTELEIPNAPRRAQVSFTEIEIPNAARRGQISFTEVEIPDGARRGQVSFTELEIPNAPRRGQISFTELEIPNAARRAQVSWTELEIPIRDRIAEVSWSEFEIGTAPRKAQISWAELEMPETLRRVQVSFTELEIGDAPRRAQISFVEVEMPDAARRGQVSFTEFEIPDAARRGMVSWTEVEIPNAARRAQISFTEIELPDAPRRAQISMAFIEIPELLAGETLRLRTQLRMGE